MTRCQTLATVCQAAVVVLCLVCPAHAADEPQAKFADHVQPFLTTYCVSCHGATKQKGERRFDRLTGQIPDDNALVDLQDILDQLNLGEMPPKDARQPSSAQRQRVIGWLTARIEQFHRERTAATGQTVLRRLNSREYRNTLRDLLHVNLSMFDPATGFPRERTSEHLDNVGQSLVTSGYLLERYLAAAERVIEKIMSPAEQPEPQTWTFRDKFRQQPEIDQVHGRTNGFSHLTLYDVVGADKHEGAYGPLLAFKQGVPFDGMYEVRFKAEAVNRRHPYDPEFLGADPAEPLRLGIVAGNAAAGPLHKPQPIEPLLAEMELADEPKWYTVRIWLDAGFAPRFTFRNGLMDVRELWKQMLKRFPDQFPNMSVGGIVQNRFNVIKFGKLPQIHIHEVQIEGPFYETWPTASQRAVLGDDWTAAHASGTLSEAQMRRHFTELASRAYRRPAQEDEIDRLLALVDRRKQAGRSPLQAYSDGLKALLCSPSFLYLEEPSDKGHALTSFALASRLSYFLWSSMPDEELARLAAADKLRDPEVLTAQVDRMLRDARSEAFVAGFLDGWITLRDLGSMPPDRSKFNEYYRYDLASAMRQETLLFTRRLIDENLSISNFLDSEFTYVNKPLAKLYGVQPPAGNGFALVRLTDRRRGGLLGQASVLTVTANGIDTSPVVRGVWLLENILGTPPSPPPPDVEPLDPDVRGAKTIREQLDKHRSVASCNDCHRKIDPLGFALESFDAIGNWRKTYDGGATIDTAGELPNGQKVSGIQDLKQVLVERQEQFATALASKLLAYALGRSLEPADRPLLAQIVKVTRERGLGFRDLIIQVALSEPFRSQ